MYEVRMIGKRSVGFYQSNKKEGTHKYGFLLFGAGVHNGLN